MHLPSPKPARPSPAKQGTTHTFLKKTGRADEAVTPVKSDATAEGRAAQAKASAAKNRILPFYKSIMAKAQARADVVAAIEAEAAFPYRLAEAMAKLDVDAISTDAADDAV